MCSPPVSLSAGTSSPLSKDPESVVFVVPSVFTQTVCPNLEAGDTLRGETEAAAVSKYLVRGGKRGGIGNEHGCGAARRCWGAKRSLRSDAGMCLCCKYFRSWS